MFGQWMVQRNAGLSVRKMGFTSCVKPNVSNDWRAREPDGPIHSLHILCRAVQIKQGATSPCQSRCNVVNLDDRMNDPSGHEKTKQNKNSMRVICKCWKIRQNCFYLFKFKLMAVHLSLVLLAILAGQCTESPCLASCLLATCQPFVRLCAVFLNCSSELKGAMSRPVQTLCGYDATP